MLFKESPILRKKRSFKSLHVNPALFSLVCSLFAGLCIAETIEPHFDTWLDSNRQINTHRWPGKSKPRPYEYKVTREGRLFIRTKYRHRFVPLTQDPVSGFPRNQMTKEFRYLCSSIFGTDLEDMTPSKRGALMLPSYPKVVEGSCMSAEKFVGLQKQREAYEAAAARRRLDRQSREQELERQSKIRKNLERKSKCSSYGFTAGTDGHAKCVMELAIAAEASERQRLADAARAAAIASQAAAANAASEAVADEARRQRQAQALIGLGAAISSGGASPSSSASSPIAPLSSGRYKTCRYRVGGEIVSSTVGRAELCPATRSIGGQTGYLVR